MPWAVDELLALVQRRAPRPMRGGARSSTKLANAVARAVAAETQRAALTVEAEARRERQRAAARGEAGSSGSATGTFGRATRSAQRTKIH